MPRILIIDDDEITLLLLQSTLKEEGFDVVATADGPRGVYLYRELRPDAVILDLGLPTMDGTEVLRRIKKEDPNAVVFVATGYGADRVAEEAKRLGARGFMRKPVPLNHLVQELRETVGPF
jgi:CheY-like chemotaxis protein